MIDKLILKYTEKLEDVREIICNHEVNSEESINIAQIQEMQLREFLYNLKQIKKHYERS
jgi:hypothetical protein